MDIDLNPRPRSPFSATPILCMVGLAVLAAPWDWSRLAPALGLTVLAPLILARTGSHLEPNLRLLRLGPWSAGLSLVRLWLVLAVFRLSANGLCLPRPVTLLCCTLVVTVLYLRAVRWRVWRNGRFLEMHQAAGTSWNSLLGQAVLESRRITLRLAKEGAAVGLTAGAACLAGLLGGQPEVCQALVAGLVPLMLSAYLSHTVKAMALGSP